MFNILKNFFKGLFSLIKCFLAKINDNLSNICMFCAILGILYTPLLLLKSENWFDIARNCLVFLFFIVDVELIRRK